eukprot:CAMPEP_0173186386 /NCGR_PEP_ID=MMETSP1141-20130122/10113_1 /TAXON_ID=483371 /ORGANISM="non described non described, Strain CCMP2298" /LENGTH=45 /DNA_ID= /DNA_START= /DNA_END= /DNA_ORIENTATION=
MTIVLVRVWLADPPSKVQLSTFNLFDLDRRSDISLSTIVLSLRDV